jgi:hypothetical protein
MRPSYLGEIPKQIKTQNCQEIREVNGMGIWEESHGHDPGGLSGVE